MTSCKPCLAYTKLTVLQATGQDCEAVYTTLMTLYWHEAKEGQKHAQVQVYLFHWDGGGIFSSLFLDAVKWLIPVAPFTNMV